MLNGTYSRPQWSYKRFVITNSGSLLNIRNSRKKSILAEIISLIKKKNLIRVVIVEAVSTVAFERKNFCLP